MVNYFVSLARIFYCARVFFFLIVGLKKKKNLKLLLRKPLVIGLVAQGKNFGYDSILANLQMISWQTSSNNLSYF